MHSQGAIIISSFNQVLIANTFDLEEKGVIQIERVSQFKIKIGRNQYEEKNDS
ncbi:unnamed protein product [Paramecium octaurelia]|uniref:Uncharacterized protein n=1 Tax=Paramecium octaurelia TaxID=43137 RepID=A0A8S1TH23_PAROT|nr:unnamed protein product [Paramecium octaurelia]